MSLLGLDIGTTGVKAVVFREDGSFLASAYKEYNLLSPAPGHLELDPSEVLSAIRFVTSSVAEKTRQDPIRSVAACTLGEAAVPVDRTGKPLGNAIIGFDARGQEEEKQFRKRLSTMEVFEITGHGISSSHTLFKILWRREHEPELFRKTDRFLCFGDFLAASLGVEARMEYSVAARTLAFDIHRLEWSRKILEAADLPAEIFPPVAAPGEPLGEVGETASREFGLPKGCVVAAGLHDQPAGILGAGVEPGESMLAIGTVICLGVRLREKPSAPSMVYNNLCYYPTFGDRQYVSLAFNFTGGSLLKWYRDNLAGPEIAEARERSVDPYDVITAGLPEAPTSLLVLPHFTTTGTPWLDPRALGAVFGLRLTTTRKEIVKAILEGILYEIRLNAELLKSAGVKIERYKAVGGAAKSAVWMQIAADILDGDVAVTTVTEGAALGAALMGAKAAGLAPTAESVHEIAARAARVERTLSPRPEHARGYGERFRIYESLYAATRDISHKLFDLSRG